MLPRRPESTYRLQFHAGFTFRDAAAVVPYLHDLGVTHCYASPYLKARPGSTHGYDVVDPTSLNPEVGTDADYDAWLAAMRERGMSHILDTVPNHMGVGTNENPWWNDVLRHGRASKYAHFFDIAWEASHRLDTRNKVLLPVLGAPYGQVLDKGELKLAFEAGEWEVRYYDRRFPIDPMTAPSGVPSKELELYNGSPKFLHALLQRQHYRLCYWRVASDEINYRRFFDINDLAALAMEREDVFDAVHRFTFELLRHGKVAGLRIDHPDGLYDPKEYFERLQRKYARDVFGDESRAAERPLYAVAEKILAIDEPLPEGWACHGTSGYDFLNMANGLYVDARNAEAFTRLYDEWVGGHTDFDDLVYRKKKLILEISLAGELHMLARQLDQIARSDVHTQDFTLNSLLHALREVIACFPVYRSYVTRDGAHESDVRHTERAVERAIARNPDTEPAVFRFVADVVLLLGAFAGREDAAHVAGKFQQVTAPTTAKGIEDTAFYIYNRLVSLNEVGGEPAHFGVTPEALHRYLADRQKLWPYALSALSTHDTKRSEDVRARLNVLSEIPDEWRQRVSRWGELNAPHRVRLANVEAPDPNDEYLIYQTLVGAWPLEPHGPEEFAAFVKRVQAYLEKALREAKVHSTWTRPNAAYEDAAKQFVATLLDEQSGATFLRDFRPFQKRIAELGLLNSLSQTLLKIVAPGVPDTYQGTELWDFSLVDPDNRRPVDYAKRRGMLETVRAGADPAELLRHKEDGRAKLFVTWKALAARKASAPLFSEGEYLPAEVGGAKRDHVFAFARRHGNRVAVVAVPRLVATLNGDWGNTHIKVPLALPKLRNVFTGETIRPDGRTLSAAGVFEAFPVALLVSGEGHALEG